jgi:hypothetical protein
MSSVNKKKQTVPNFIESYLKKKKKNYNPKNRIRTSLRYFKFDMTEKTFSYKDNKEVNEIKVIHIGKDIRSFYDKVDYEDSKISDFSFGFKIVTSMKTYVLFAETKDIFLKWIRVLHFYFNKMDILSPESNFNLAAYSSNSSIASDDRQYLEINNPNEMFSKIDNEYNSFDEELGQFKENLGLNTSNNNNFNKKANTGNIFEELSSNKNYTNLQNINPSIQHFNIPAGKNINKTKNFTDDWEYLEKDSKNNLVSSSMTSTTKKQTHTQTHIQVNQKQNFNIIKEENIISIKTQEQAEVNKKENRIDRIDNNGLKNVQNHESKNLPPQSKSSNNQILIENQNEYVLNKPLISILGSNNQASPLYKTKASKDLLERATVDSSVSPVIGNYHEYPHPQRSSTPVPKKHTRRKHEEDDEEVVYVPLPTKGGKTSSSLNIPKLYENSLPNSNNLLHEIIHKDNLGNLQKPKFAENWHDLNEEWGLGDHTPIQATSSVNQLKKTNDNIVIIPPSKKKSNSGNLFDDPKLHIKQAGVSKKLIIEGLHAGTNGQMVNNNPNIQYYNYDNINILENKNNAKHYNKAMLKLKYSGTSNSPNKRKTLSNNMNDIDLFDPADIKLNVVKNIQFEEETIAVKKQICNLDDSTFLMNLVVPSDKVAKTREIESPDRIKLFKERLVENSLQASVYLGKNKHEDKTLINVNPVEEHHNVSTIRELKEEDIIGKDMSNEKFDFHSLVMKIPDKHLAMGALLNSNNRHSVVRGDLTEQIPHDEHHTRIDKTFKIDANTFLGDDYHIPQSQMESMLVKKPHNDAENLKDLMLKNEDVLKLESLEPVETETEVRETLMLNDVSRVSRYSLLNIEEVWDTSIIEEDDFQLK